MRAAWLGLLAATVLCTVAAHAADECAFNITGTWEASVMSGSEPAPPTRYVFGADGMVATLVRSGSSEWHEGRNARRFYYKLDNLRKPTRIQLIGPDGAQVRGDMKISQADDGSFTTVDPNDLSTRWTRVDNEEHHFISFMASQGDVARGGASFVTLIATDAQGRPRWDSFGLYLTDDVPIVGPIPAELVRKLMTESRLSTQTMLRLELTPSEYQRALTVMQSWERRARERTMFYEVPYLNSIVFVEQMATSLNRCSSRIKVQKLGWNVGDPITASHNTPQVPFFYIRELRRQNETLHLTNAQFWARMGSACNGECSMPGTTASMEVPRPKR